MGGRSSLLLLIAGRLLLHQLLTSLPLRGLKAVHELAVRALREDLIPLLQHRLLLNVRLESLSWLTCRVMELVLSSCRLRDHVDCWLAAVANCSVCSEMLARCLRGLLLRPWIEFGAARLSNVFEAIAHPALTLIDLHTDGFFVWLTLQLVVLLGVAGLLQRVCAHLLHHEVVCQLAWLALELRSRLRLGSRRWRCALLLWILRRPSFLDF